MRPGRILAAVLLAGVLCAGAGRGAGAQALVADLSDHLIAISTAFTGTEVVLFGSIQPPGDVVVVVRGPPHDMVVRRKAPTAGIWINEAGMTFVGVPSFYGVASNRPVRDFASEAALERHGIGLDSLRLAPADPAQHDPEQVAAFRAGLIRNLQGDGVYGADIGRVAFLGDRLFRTTLSFPANVPTGQFIVSVLLFRNGEVVAAQTTPLFVSKIGLGAEVYTFATRHGAAYGAIAVVLAVVSGWLASVIFRRG
jgi:uncharacterized protein (TIGR02186 family)